MLLQTNALTAFYGDFQALFGVDIEVAEGETIAIIGANGAGKSTLLRSIAGVLKSTAEMVQFEGSPVGDLPSDILVARGIAMVPEGRKLFPSLSVEENLMIGAYSKRANSEKAGGQWNLETVFNLFPILREKRKIPSTALSGGQQQMVAIGRALMSNPRLLLCDEISLGLAPVVIKDFYANMPKIKASGASIVIIEQDVSQAMKVADRVYCMMEGRISLSGKPSEITREQVHAAYFGVAP
jgi:branched-chain amino acid transport system ATP-binding protein